MGQSNAMQQLPPTDFCIQVPQQDGTFRKQLIPPQFLAMQPEWQQWVANPETFTPTILQKYSVFVQQWQAMLAARAATSMVPTNLHPSVKQEAQYELKEAVEQANKNIKEQSTNIQQIAQAQSQIDPLVTKLWSSKYSITDVKKEGDREFVPSDRANLLLKEALAGSLKNPKCTVDVEKVVRAIAEDFVTSGIDFAIGMARKRKIDHILPKDLALYYQQQWGIAVPGFLTEQRIVKPYRRPAISEAHRSRMAAIRKATLTGDGQEPQEKAMKRKTTVDEEAK